MLNSLLSNLGNHAVLVTQRSEGPAFFRVAKDLYGLSNITYACLNISLSKTGNQYMHCFYTESIVKQFVSKIPYDVELTDDYSINDNSINCDPLEQNLKTEVINRDQNPFVLMLPLRQQWGETAFFKIAGYAPPKMGEQATIARECQILADYFHSHILRMNGYDVGSDLLISARELDCLKWTAAGKTAWEASMILGISERTVRFHLNTAREKLNCTNTTQAVAKAVANRLIEI